MYHHGLMIQTQPPHISAWRFKFDCTDVDEARSGLRLLRVVDQAFVAYICLHTGLSGRGIPDWAVIMVCLVSALGGIPFVGFVITVALYLTVPKLADISEVQQAQFALAALGPRSVNGPAGGRPARRRGRRAGGNDSLHDARARLKINSQ